MWQNNNPTYPTAIIDSTIEGAIAVNLRSLLDANGLSSIRIIGSESNWIDSYYPGAVVRLFLALWIGWYAAP